MPANLEISGILGCHPRIFHSNSGIPVCSFFLNHKVKATGKIISFHCVAFKALAEYIAQSYAKGSYLHILKATPDEDRWTDKATGQQRTRLKWILWEINEFSTVPDDAGAQQVADETIPF